MENATSNFESLDEEVFTIYAGKWIAVIDGNVICSGNSFKEVNEFVMKNCPKKKALFGKLPQNAYSVFSLI